MRKSKKRVIAIITCCFVIATFCVGVYADDIDSSSAINPSMDRVGTVLTTTPFDIGELVIDLSYVNNYVLQSGYYILKVNCNQIPDTYQIYNYYSITVNGTNISHNFYYYSSTYNNFLVKYYLDSNSDYSNDFVFTDTGTYYVYAYFDSDVTISGDNNTYNNIQVYSIANRSVIDSVYSNSQDVNSSIVSVINEATNVITTNNVVMMFCILIPVISFGVGILIRLRKRS